jgi:lipopolysaccharide transport system ATP-binding protein
MSDIALRLEGLSKQYHISGPKKVYDRLGEQLLDLTTAPLRRASKLLRGRASGAAELDQTIWALKDVSIEIKGGEAVGVIGRNGAGKSTLLKILSRITEPTLGYADLFGRVGSLLEVGTGFHPELTGRENVYLNGAILGMKKREIDRKFDEIMAFAEIDNFIDTPIKHYSSGMYVRLAFSVAAHLEPEILLVDEVLAVGDIAFQKKCLGKMDNLTHQGRTILFVSHNMGLVQSLCQRGILLNQGTKIIDGPIDEAINSYLRALERAGEQRLDERNDRVGRGEVRVIKVEISNGYNHPSSILRTGGPARFVFHLNKIMAGISCLFVVFNHYGQQLAVFESSVVGPEDTYDPDLGPTFICELDELMLLPGQYRINVLVRDSGGMQDSVEGAAIFDVEAGQLNGRPMKSRRRTSVCMPHRWRQPLKI